MINAENLSKSFGGTVLFEGAGFKINRRERIGLVGRNGYGKTTLFKMLIGEERSDSGHIAIPKRYRIGYVKQRLEFIKATVLENCMTGLGHEEKDHFWKAEKILFGLGFSKTDMNRSPADFSGGYQVRLNLAKILVSDPDLLLLDEPTNYLDIASIRWITQFLNSWPHEMILITHDRGFMDSVVTHTMGIHRLKIRKIAGTTEKYYSQIAQDEEIYEKTRVNDEKRRKEIELFITRFRAKARLANLVQSRIKTLSKMTPKEQLENLKTLDFSFRSKHFPSKHVMSAKRLSFSYETDTPLFQDFNISIMAGDRVCIIGKNGKGKTTLLKLLAKHLVPETGEIVYNPNVTEGFFEQTNVQSLNESNTVETEILYTSPDIDRQKARNICGAMMFPGDNALKKIRVLSGGEKSRVMLGKLLVTPVNLLLLDEPTNHLDMESCDTLLSAIAGFNGTVIMVTHNEMFLHTLSERLIVFQKDRLTVFEGSYSEFLEKEGWDDEISNIRPAQNHPEIETNKMELSKKERKQVRSDFFTRRSKAVKPFKTAISRIENDIETTESQLAEFNEEMITASQNQDSQKIADLSKLTHQCQNAITRLYESLETEMEELEQIRKTFDTEFQNLNLEPK